MARYLVTTKCEMLLTAKDEDDARTQAIQLLDAEAEIFAGEVLSVTDAGDVGDRMGDFFVRGDPLMSASPPIPLWLVPWSVC